MRVVVFLGPSLPVRIAESLLVAEYRGPISLGDLCDLMIHADPPDVVGIIDGLFEQVPSVWHKEILYAMDRGTAVFGASSMGALRAAETHRFGMHGVGEVFERFRSGQYTDDDEVAIAHAAAEDGYRPLSEAMVNIRHGLERAVGAGILTPAQQRQLVAAAKARFYPDRSWPAVIDSARHLGIPDATAAALGAFIRAERPDVKRADALRMLHTIARFVAGGPRPAAGATFDFEPTYYWDKLVTIVRDARHRTAIAEHSAGDAQPTSDVLPPAPPDVLASAFDDLLVVREARRLGLPAAMDGGTASPAALRSTLMLHYRSDLSGFVLDRLLARPADAGAPREDAPQVTRVPRHSSRAE
jgi:hypothetical protein